MAVTRAVLNESISLEYGGVQIYDDGVMRPQSLCGFGQGGCTSLGGATDTFESIQWNSNGTEMFSANEDAGAGDFYRISVSSTGFGAISDYPGVAGNDDANIFEIEYDPMTDRVYDEDGNIIDPNSGVRIGTFPAAGILAVDGSLGKAFFLKPISEDSSTYLLKSFDIHTLAPIATMQIQGSPQAPTHLIRWGTDGLAFTTCLNEDGDSLNCTKNIGTPGPVYVVQGSFVSGN